MKLATGGSPWSMSAEGSRGTIDFGAIVARVDLKGLIADDIGPPLRGGRWPCPFHEGENPNLSVDHGGRRWRCFVCGKSGSALDWLMLREDITVVEAARRLDPMIGDGPRQQVKPKPTPKPPVASPKPPAAFLDASWQSAVDRIVLDAEAALWGKQGGPALDWLRARGLEDHTIRRFRLGFIARDFDSAPMEVLGRSIWARRGVTIPWVRPESWYSVVGPDPGPRWVGCNVRRLSGEFGNPADGPKYQALTGSERGHAYPFSDMTPGVPAIICEGEFDALVAWQEAGVLANVVTIGGVGQDPKPAAREALDSCPAWLLLFDHDANHAGDKAATKWRQRNRHRSRRLWLPSGKDLSDFHAAGGNIREWLKSEWTRFGWPWPL